MCLLDLLGLMISSRAPGASMGDISLWQGDPTVEGRLMILTFVQVESQKSFHRIYF